MNKRTKVVHLGMQHSPNDKRIRLKECESLINTGEYDVVYYTSERQAATTDDPVVKGYELRLRSFIHRIGRKEKETIDKLISEETPSIVHIHEYSIGYVIPYIKKKYNYIRVIYDIHENYPRIYYENYRDRYGELIGKIAGCIVYRWDMTLAEKADHVITIMDSLSDRFSRVAHVKVIRNYPIIGPEEPHIDERRCLYQICYTGGITNTKGCGTLCSVADRIKGRIVFAGRITDDFRVYFENAQKIKSNIEYKGVLSHEEVDEIYRESEMGFCVYKNLSSTYNSSPNKLYEYMMAGIPVVCSDFPQWREMIDEYQCGIYVDPDDENAIVDALNYLIDHRDEAAQMGRNGRKAIEEKYNWSYEEKKLLNLYSEYSNNKKKLYLISAKYPNDVMGDTAFIRPEIDQLAQKYSITVLCLAPMAPKQVPHDDIQCIYMGFNGNKLKKYLVLSIFQRALFEDIKEICCLDVSPVRKFRMIRASMDVVADAIWFDKHARKMVDVDNGMILYSFWGLFPIVSLLMNRKRYGKCSIICRLHGGDLYDERHYSGRQPFRKYINERIDRLVFVARNPFYYYINRHPELDEEKTAVCRLGIEPIDHSGATRSCDKMMLVSCSSLIPLKRVDMIIEALARYRGECDIKWIHIGDGKSAEDIRELASTKLTKSKKISYELRGFVRNDEIRALYANTIIDCFITTSSTEGGAPVSIMEALSVGTPVIGTSVGDIPYMIKGNGILLSVNPDISEVAEAIEKMAHVFTHRESDMQYTQMRMRSEEIFEEYFDSRKNTEYFVGEVLEQL